MKKIIKILLTIQLLTSGAYCYCQSNVTPTGTTSYFAIGGYNAFDHSTPATPVILDGQDLGCYEEDGHPGGLHQDAMTSNTSVSLYVYNGGTSDLHLPSDVYIKIIYNINDPSIPYTYSFNTDEGYVYGTPIPFTLTDKGEYNFIYELWKTGVSGSPDFQVFPSPCPRPIYLWYDTPINPDDITFEANATSVCTGSTVCFSTNYQPAVYYYSKCGSSGHHWFQNSPILVDFDDPWDLINFPPPLGDAGVMTYPFLSLVLDQTNLSSGSVPQHLEIPYDPSSTLLCHTYTDPGVYTARLYLDNYISQVIIPLTITVGDHFDVTITYDNNCNDFSSVLTANSGDFPPYSYSWSTSATTNPITVSSDGTYSVTVTKSSTCNGTAHLSLDRVDCCRESSGLLSFDGSPSAPYDLNSITLLGTGTTVEIALNGTLSNTSALTINNCPNLSMGEKAEIVVNSGQTLTIINSHLQSCDKMWKGIYVKAGATLILDNTTIEDALEAIHVEGIGHIEVTNSTFDRDYIGIGVWNSETVKTDIIEANTFKCTGGNTLRAPHTGKRTLYGITLYKVRGILIGDQLESTTTSNKFLSINNGIVSTASDVSVYNNLFDNIYDYNNSPYIYEGKAISSSDKVYYGNSSAPILNVYTNPVESSTIVKFTDCYKGIYLEGTDANIFYNNMDNAYYGIQEQNTRAKHLTIDHNRLTNTAFGITCNLNLGCSTIINENSIEVIDPGTFSTFPFSYSNSYGISIAEASPKLAGHYLISNNDVVAGRNAIKLLNLNAYDQIYKNNIFFTSSTAITGKENGILATNCNGTIIQGNTVEGNGSTYIEAGVPILSPFRKRGIAIDASKNLVIGCNEITGIGYGIHFQANCETEAWKIAENTVADCKYGWVLQKLFSHGYIGANVGYNTSVGAKVNDNVFSGTFANPDNYRTFNFTNAAGVVFVPTIWHTSTDPEPTNNGNSFSASDFRYSIHSQNISIGVPYSNSNICANAIDYEDVAGLGLPDFNVSEKDMELINNELYTGYDELVTRCLEEEDLYEKLGKDSILLNAVIEYSLFYNDKKEQFIGDQSSFEKTYADLSNTLILVDSITFEAALQGSIDANENINSILPHEMNMKRVQSIYLWMLANDTTSLSQSDKSFLESMYYACPYIAGRAVYMARAIYPLLDDVDFVDDLELCHSQGIYRMTNPNENTVIEEKIQSKNLIFLKQNPSDESIQVIYDFPASSTAEMELLSINGQLIGTYGLNLEEHQFSIDVHGLSSGVYMLYAKTDNQFTKKMKVSIVH